MDNIHEEQGFEPAASDAELDSFLGLDDVEDSNLEAAPLNIEMSDAQKEEVERERLEAEELAAQELENQNQNTNTETPDLINQLLEAKGIKGGVVVMEDDEGKTEEIPFADLTPEEQFEILNGSNEEAPSLNENEQSTIDFLRKNNVTFEQAIDYFAKKAVAEATASVGAANSVADYTDEEIYSFELLSKYKDLSEEEIQLELDKQREHPDLFKKKVDALREQYLQAEKDQIAQEELEAQRLEKEEFEKITQTLVGVAKEVEDIGGLDIEVEDKQEILGFILNKDVNGVTEFGKLLDDPKALFEIAWYAKKGKEAFDTIHEYYKKEITEANRKGYEKAKLELSKSAPEKPTVSRPAVYKPKEQRQNLPVNQPQQFMSVEELYTDLIQKPNK